MKKVKGTINLITMNSISESILKFKKKNINYNKKEYNNLKKKKVLFVANVAKEHICKFHIPTIKLLKKNGWIVDVACVNDGDIDLCDHYWNMNYKRNPISLKTLVGIKQLRIILKENDYDIVYCHTPTGSIVARLAMIKLKNKPIVIYMAHGFHFYQGAPIKNWILYYPIEKFLSNWTDYLITINREDYNFAKKKHMYKKKIFKVPGIGVNLKKFKKLNGINCRKLIRKEFSIEENEILLIYVAELISNKNQGKLIDVLKELDYSYKNIKLMLVGPEHDNGMYRKYAKKQGLENKVIFTGWRSDIGKLLYSADLYVASSVREGFGINIVEAMACGLPVVAFDNRGHKEIIENGINGYMVEQGNIKEMVKKIEVVLGLNYREYSKNACACVKKYDQKMVTKTLVAILESTL